MGWCQVEGNRHTDSTDYDTEGEILSFYFFKEIILMVNLFGSYKKSGMIGLNLFQEIQDFLNEGQISGTDYAIQDKVLLRKGEIMNFISGTAKFLMKNKKNHASDLNNFS